MSNKKSDETGRILMDISQEAARRAMRNLKIPGECGETPLETFALEIGVSVPKLDALAEILRQTEILAQQGEWRKQRERMQIEECILCGAYDNVNEEDTFLTQYEQGMICWMCLEEHQL